MSVVVDRSPIGVGRLDEIDARRDEGHVLQRTEHRVTFTLARYCGLFLDRTFADAAKYELARGHVDLRAFKACLDPDFCHDIVGWIVAPPRPMMLRLRRQLCAGNAFDLAERQRNFLGALLAQIVSKRLVFAHGWPPTYTQCVT